MSLSNTLAMKLNDNLATLNKNLESFIHAVRTLQESNGNGNGTGAALEQRISTAVSAGILDALTTPSAAPAPKPKSDAEVMQEVMRVLGPAPAQEVWPRMVMPESVSQYMSRPIPIPKCWATRSRTGMNRNLLHAVWATKPECRTAPILKMVMDECFRTDHWHGLKAGELGELIGRARVANQITPGPQDGPYGLTEHGRNFVDATHNQVKRMVSGRRGTAHEG